MVATVAATTSTLRARVHATLRHSDDSRSGRRWRAFHLLVLGSGLLAVAVSSVPSLPDAVEHLLAFVIALVAAVFLVEYALRLWSAPETPRYGGLSEGRARLAWALSATGLIGLLAVVPAFAITLRAIRADSDIAAIFCILWILKLSVHAPAMTTLARVISNERATLASVLIIFVIVLVAAATATHFFERSDQPDLFGDLPSSLWWAVVTLTTTGYGDIVPHTVGGRIVGSVVMVSGILVLALMTGILATGFAEEVRRREYLRVWDQVVKVPMFTELGTVTLSEIVGKLRVRYYPPRFVVVRRDEPGDSMFFISEGEVEVRLPRQPVRLGQGGFFGEMALLDRLPRSATIVTTRPTTLLVLYASDFYEIAAHIPSLVAAVEKEAHRRRRENEAGRMATDGAA
ncbi:MAG TPA: cyclic nucleotide-gated ion channel [Reyranella sp.]|jgi:voltage-gated potassium channel|nr:cyclic nucleotide-gated ion channel [Reyranella sp.]